VPLYYLADSAHAPYGERSAEFIRERSLALAKHLVDAGAALLVIACNTATAHAADALRQRFPALPIVGIEPGVKPAVQATRNGRVGVLATTATVQSERFRRLVAQHAGSVQLLPVACAGVVGHVEAGDLDSPALRELVESYCAPLREAGVDTVLLGCTHYPLLKPLWQAALPGVNLMQIEDAVAQQAKRLWPHAQHEKNQGLTLASTGDPDLLLQLARGPLGWRDACLGPKPP
jgi:glutamate racemase